MGCCKDCKWWTPLPLTDQYSYVMDDDDWEWSEKHYAPLTRQWGMCELAATRGRVLAPTTRALAMDGEQYVAWLYTAPDFGCVQFEAKK